MSNQQLLSRGGHLHLEWNAICISGKIKKQRKLMTSFPRTKNLSIAILLVKRGEHFMDSCQLAPLFRPVNKISVFKVLDGFVHRVPFLHRTAGRGHWGRVVGSRPIGAKFSWVFFFFNVFVLSDHCSLWGKPTIICLFPEFISALNPGLTFKYLHSKSP